jgi:hypothetical protein
MVAARNQNRVVRLFLPDTLISGRIRSIDRTALLIQRRSVRWEELDSAQVRFVEEDPVWNGALIGAGASGVVLTAFVGAVAKGIGDSPLTDGQALGIFAAGALIGAVLGAGFDGASVGPASWRTVWSPARSSTIDER